jgi:putative adenylate-forming enzyme
MKQTLSVLWHYLLAKRVRHRWRNRDELAAWQDRMVRKHMSRVWSKSPYYKRLHQGCPASGWSGFPVVSKPELMDHFDEWNTAGIRREQAWAVALAAENSRNFTPTIGDITIGLSSGTSGNRGLFLVSAAERYAWAGNLLAKILPGSLLDRHRAALCFRANSNLYRSVGSRRIEFRFFDLLEPLDRVSRQLHDFQPTFLVGPPALLRLLAEERRAGRLDIAPTRIVSVAEVLEPHERLFIEQQFGRRLHEVYQATEGFLASTCAHGTLHLNEDIVVVQKEWLDRARLKFIPVITDFCRITQPIIRYRLNDILTERRQPCPCGSIFTALESIEGRCDDILKFQSFQTRASVPVFPDFIRRAIITADDSISEYFVRQLPDRRLEIALKIPEKIRFSGEHSVRLALANLCEKLGCQLPEINFIPFVAPSLNVKSRRVQAAQNSANS